MNISDKANFIKGKLSPAQRNTLFLRNVIIKRKHDSWTSIDKLFKDVKSEIAKTYKWNKKDLDLTANDTRLWWNILKMDNHRNAIYMPDFNKEVKRFSKSLDTGLTIDQLTEKKRKGYDLYDETLKWIKETTGNPVYVFEAPMFNKIKGLDPFYKTKHNGPAFLDPKGVLNKKVFECRKCGNNVKKIITIFDQPFYNGKLCMHKDYHDNTINISNGYRTPIQNQKLYNQHVNIYGPCTAFGRHSVDECTIDNYLNESTNRCIINRSGVPRSNKFKKYSLDLYYQLRNTKQCVGSINIIVGITTAQEKLAYRNNNVPYFELSHLFNAPHNYGLCFTDYGAHFTCVANKVIAEYIAKLIDPAVRKHKPVDNPTYYTMDDINDPKEREAYLKEHPDLKKYLDDLSDIKVKQNISGNVGSIVMNCNPFTKGHRYLIEQAAKQVDKLVIFVVEEDKSDYPFKDRIDLVKQGTQDLDNVIVLPSGSFIISYLTFPEYFVKGQKQNDKIDPSKDVLTFAKYIAPTLGIKTRFVGEEPFDTVTRQYNESMNNILPTFGVKFVEIPRKTTDGKDDVISASKVRKLLSENKWNELIRYVPKTTYDYLVKTRKK